MPVSGEVTLWAVDYGLLSLTGYSMPDLLRAIYVPKALQVATADNRQRLLSRGVMTGPFGIESGVVGGLAGGLAGGVPMSAPAPPPDDGGQVSADGDVRHDFRSLFSGSGRQPRGPTVASRRRSHVRIR